MRPDIQEIFARALEHPRGERGAFLAEACGEDRELREEVESLLAAYERADDFLEEPASSEEAPGSRIGRYRLTEIVGEGGFGTVWFAEQLEPLQRRVALKIARQGTNSPQVAAVLEAEQQLLALLDHPDIARVLDAGATDSGRPFFVMEPVEGPPITRYCRQGDVPLRARLHLFRRVCLAVQHAHQKGVIHQDLKPSNVLVTLQDGRPRPKVIDFGIARAVRQDRARERNGSGGLLGTPEYMAPEQIAGDTDIDTRADCYALGALLYELVTDHPPFDLAEVRSDDPAEVLRYLRETDPAPLRQRRPGNPGRSDRPLLQQLEWIVRKAMAKDRTRRYASASDLATDVERLLTRQPVSAGPTKGLYRVRLFVARNRALVVAAVLIALSMMGGIVGTTLSLGRAKQAEESAKVEAKRAREQAVRLAAVQEFLQEEMLGSIAPDRDNGPDVTVLEVLDNTAATLATGRFDRVPDVAADLHRHLGGLYRQLGRLESAERHSRRAVQLRRGTGGPEDLARDLSFLADCLVARGSHEAAGSALSEGIAICAGHEDRRGLHAELLLLRGKMHRSRGGLDAATSDFQRALTVLDGLDDSEPDRMSSALHNLAEAASARGEHDRALALFERSLELKRRESGEDHLEVARGHANVALVLMRMGDLDGAERRLRRALATFRRVLAEDHDTTAVHLVNLGGLLHARGDLPGAIETTAEALRMFRAVFGEHHLQVANALNNLGGYHEESGDLESAERYYREALANHEATEHPSPEKVAPVCFNLGSLLRRRGELAEAAKLLARAVEGKTEVFGDDHPAVVDSLYWLADVRRALGDLDRAEAGYRQALRILRATPDSGRKLAGVLAGLGTLLVARGRAAEGEPCLMECLRLRRRCYPEDHWLIPYTAAACCRALAEVGRLEEAEELLAETRPMSPPPGLEERRLEWARWIAQVHRALGRSDKEAEWLHRAREIESAIGKRPGR